MMPGASVSREFFDVMGVRPIVGRGFRAEEQQRRRRASGDHQRSPVAHCGFDGAPLDTLTLRIESHGATLSSA